jgi:hypothetical protein
MHDRTMMFNGYLTRQQMLILFRRLMNRRLSIFLVQLFLMTMTATFESASLQRWKSWPNVLVSSFLISPKRITPGRVITEHQSSKIYPLTTLSISSYSIKSILSLDVMKSVSRRFSSIKINGRKINDDDFLGILESTNR